VDEILEKVRNGVAETAVQLDKMDTAWYDRVDLSKLDMAKMCGCVAGQAFGAFTRTIEKMENFLDRLGRNYHRFLEPADSFETGQEARPFDKTEFDLRNKILTEMWTDEVLKRRCTADVPVYANKQTM
jgi:hypothetical protein